MKTIFAVEKSTYSHLLTDLLRGKLSSDAVYETLVKMKTIEELVETQGDKIITIVTTENTNKIECAPAMSVDNIMKESPISMPLIKNRSDLNNLAQAVVQSPPCDECKHKRISHNHQGCRFCDCKMSRKKGEA